MGVEDDGAVTGVRHDDTTNQSLLVAWRTHVHERLHWISHSRSAWSSIGQLILYFSVEKGTSFVHLTQDGRCLQRKDRESIPVASEVVNFERQERMSREYDRGFVDGADATVLNEATLAFAGNVIAPGSSPEKVLQLLGLAEYGGASLRLRRAALLLFANDVSLWHPRCEVRILRVSGSEASTLDVNTTLSKTSTLLATFPSSCSWLGKNCARIWSRLASARTGDSRAGSVPGRCVSRGTDQCHRS